MTIYNAIVHSTKSILSFQQTGGGAGKPSFRRALEQEDRPRTNNSKRFEMQKLRLHQFVHEIGIDRKSQADK